MSSNAKVTKTQLIAEISQSMGVTQIQAEKFLKSFTEVTTQNLINNNTVTITGFGSFRKVVRSARNGVNPKTKEPIQIPESITVSFRAGKSLKSSVS